MAEDGFSPEQMQQLQAVFQGAIHNALNTHLQPAPTSQLQPSVANPLQREFTNLADLITDMYERQSAALARIQASMDKMLSLQVGKPKANRASKL
ncbi:hypothetical protein LTR56_022054 [Elasticomyces elasticus]|nr:hypothetical protein LTR56_022054 [Elasticomyces elasticus]KAK3664974.1 hypothetical protein LTR22_004280 [Elasticomyces elasticus]KAK4929793.1 hypothetical protein LTR49_003751 [Elasticomyces elasticus]KAK5756953.1 hypothetical protein LTS12_012903 [Elasticomyces elasticus]